TSARGRAAHAGSSSSRNAYSCSSRKRLPGTGRSTAGDTVKTGDRLPCVAPLQRTRSPSSRRCSTACPQCSSTGENLTAARVLGLVSCADRSEQAFSLEPRSPRQRAGIDPRDSGLQRSVHPPDSDPRAPWRPPVSANPAQGSLATGTAHPTLVETLRRLADRVGPERATRLKLESRAPHTDSG